MGSVVSSKQVMFCNAIVRNSLQTSISPYILKQLRDRDDMDVSQYLIGMRDLRKEANILAELKHDNIIRTLSW